MPSLYVSTFLARLVGSSGPMLITLYVVTTLDRSYSQAGWVTSILVIGLGVGAPLAGWALDRGRGRLLVGVTAVVEATFWLFAGHLSYLALLFVAVATAAFPLPSHTLPRWTIATRLDERTRQAAYTVDSICSEASYMVGPPAAVLLASSWGARPVLAVLAGMTVLVGIIYLAPAGMTRVQPGRPAGGTPVAPSQPEPQARSAMRAAMGPFIVVGAAMTLLAATEVLLIALMRSRNEMDQLGIVVLAWCASSIVGALIFAVGGLKGGATVLLGVMALCSMLIGLASSWWQTALLLIPSGFLNAPVLAASSEWLTRVVPPSLRGRFTGWHTLALTIGLAIGAPAGGLLADHVPLWLSFCLLGLVGLLAALTAAALSPAGRQSTASSTRSDPPSGPNARDVA
ncbi:MFS transporter [Kribbella speibonae]|uniref:MFS transporter n=1 Tax=Kribbella speibonae TaxID=1572660 RepID=A0A4R0IV52_9ACTN|nr:MFS transporter [Kribbella speibonae]TCC36424.1 MFS transporter [Kribbella speibonae]